jgi:hypothetical protein
MRTSCTTIATVFLVSGFLLPIHLFAQEDIAALIEQFVEIDKPGTGYAQYFSGSDFLPYEDTESIGTLIIGATGRERSPTMKKVVESGVNAIPELIKHLDDDRKVCLPSIESGGIMWILFQNEYDFNRATTKDVPNGVNLDLLTMVDGQPDRHEVTVGDICFVTLGQIVNRDWSAVRYHPSGSQIINSPTFSKDLRQAIINEWGKLDPDSHRKKLIEDFQKPDWEQRKIGAYLRLSYYYPNDVEKLVLEFLDRPVTSLDKTVELALKLTSIDNPVDRKNTLKSMIDDCGEHFRESIEIKLFEMLVFIDIERDDLTDEMKRALIARDILHKEFGWPADVTLVHLGTKPRTTYNENEMARFIEALTHDNSVAIGNRVKQIMESERFKDDDSMVEACLKCLASREQFGDYLAEILKKVDFRTATHEQFRTNYLRAIATSKSPAVIKQLEHIVNVATDPDTFIIVAKAVPRESWEPVLTRAKQILAELPADTTDGGQLLTLIVEKSPADAERILVEFLQPNTTQRCDTVCEVVWYGNPLSQKVLLPLLDDQRSLVGFNGKLRVCDRAAQAISHSIEDLKFSSDWSKYERDYTIGIIKEYCRGK